MKKNYFSILMLLLSLLWSIPNAGIAALTASENFDGSEWPTVSGTPPSSSLAINWTTNGWTITRGSVSSNSTPLSTSPNTLWLYKTTNVNSSLTSPTLSNGIGAVTFDYRGNSAASMTILIKTFDGSNWVTNGTISSVSSTYAGYSNAINSYTAQKLMIERTDSSAQALALDTVRITTPPPLVTISNVTTSIARPADQDPVYISANVGIRSIADTFAMTNYWREWPSTSWTNLIAMTSNSPTLYTSASAIPGKSIGTLIEYLARATYSADGTAYTTNSSTNAYLVLPKSSYTNLAVTGQLNASLRNGANYQWQGVIQVTNINPTFKFQGTSNAVTTTWGDVNQSVTNMPLYGQAEVTTSNITLNTTNAGYYLFALTETNLEYSVRSCTYENFDTWTTSTYNAFGTYTNNLWVLTSGNTSNDTTRLFDGSGRSAVVETNGWIRSPYLTNGVGQISFWYRNWPTNATPTGKFQIQTSTNATDWTSLASGALSNIISTNYLFFSVAANDRNSKYVRILNTQTAATARLCFDEVVIAQPGAGVSDSNLGTTPTTPTILDPITISIDLSPYNGGMISNVTAWYRIGTSGAWESGTMTSTDNIHYALSTPITGVPTGTLQYAVQCYFSGFQSASPVFFPSSGTNSPASVTVGTPSDTRYQPFDGSEWPAVSGNPPSSSLASSWTTNGWTTTRCAVSSNSSPISTSPNTLWLYRSTNVNSSLASQTLSNGIGTVTFDYRGNNAGSMTILLKSFDGTTWTTNGTISSVTASYTGYTNSINSYTAQQIMIERTDSVNLALALDTVRITYPPANVAITNVYINPGYPVAGQTFTGSCDVVTLNPYFPAYNIKPTFNYWPLAAGGTTSSVPMNRVGVVGTTYNFSMGTNTSIIRDTPYGYNVSVTFDGYYGSDAEKRSPLTNSPSGSFTTRAYVSEYGNIGILINGTTNSSRMLTNGLWQSLVSFTTNVSTFNLSFQGSGYSAGSGYLSNSIPWGNTNNWKTTIPLNDLAGTNQANIALTGSFSGDYLVRFNEQTGEYLVQQCTYQDFESWNGAGAGSSYVRSENVNFPLVTNNFDNWTSNQTLERTDDFSSLDWSALSTYTNWAFGGVNNYVMYYSKITGASIQTTNRSGDSFVLQWSRLATPSANPLRGVGTISFDYKTSATNPPASITVKYYNDVVSTNYADYTASAKWADLPSNSVINATNTSNITKTMLLNTNASLDLIFAHSGGDQSIYLDTFRVTEWYADSQTNGGWITSESYIEQRPNAVSGNLWCKFDITRNDQTADQQFVMSPVCSNGINSISLNYCGATTNPVSFSLDRRFGSSGWTTLVSVTNNSTTNLFAYSYTVGTSTNNAQLRIRNTSPVRGILCVDDFKISAKIAGLTWGINNASIDETDPSTPPATRQFYGGACYLNSNTIANINFGDPTNAPDTNATAYLLSPKLTFGVGEISFWYRNWATASPRAATLYVQTSTKDLPVATNSTDWNTVTVLSNIVNIADYQYLQLALYDRTSQWVRIYNDISTNVGRACLDDVLITAPMASSFAMSNLTVSPLIPLYTNTVDVMVDIYQLFLNPTNITLTALYGTSTNYAGLTNATLTTRPMTCIASNLTAPGRWYRYKTSTPIPTNAIDTFISYSAKASWGGLNAAVASPKTNLQFGSSPVWYNPLHLLYGTNQAYYIVYSCPTGAVWINEFNYDDWDLPAPQFVELCGKDGIPIGNWQLQMFNNSLVSVGQYQITNGAVLLSPTNGFGFWVFGDSTVTSRNQLLTNNLPYSGGLRLVRSCGVYEQAICYSDSQANLSTLTNAGFRSIGSLYDDYWNDNVSLSLAGIGSNYSDFVWTNFYALSAGLINGGQTFIGVVSETVPPIITIYSFRINTNVWIECTKTSGWYNTPWYSTNLLYSNLWATMTPFTNIPNASNDVLSFTKPTNSPVYFYKVVSTNGL